MTNPKRLLEEFRKRQALRPPPSDAPLTPEEEAVDSPLSVTLGLDEDDDGEADAVTFPLR